MDTDASTCTDPDATASKALEVGDLDVILQDTISYLQESESLTIVFCPRKRSSCQSLEALQKVVASKIGKVVLIWSCASGKSTKRDVACEEEIVDVMLMTVPVGKYSSFVINPDTPRKMGHVLREAFSTSSV